MADFIRREIKPLLKGIDENLLEAIVGILEISGESGQLHPDNHGDLMDMLLISYCSKTKVAAKLCEQLAAAANVRITGGVSAEETFGTDSDSDVAAIASEYQTKSWFVPTSSQLVAGAAVLACIAVVVSGLRRKR